MENQSDPKNIDSLQSYMHDSISARCLKPKSQISPEKFRLFYKRSGMIDFREKKFVSKIIFGEKSYVENSEF